MRRTSWLAPTVTAIAIALTGCGQDGLSPTSNAGWDGAVSSTSAGEVVTVAAWTGPADQVKVLCTEVDGVITMTVVAPTGSTASTARPDSGAGTASVTIAVDGKQTTIAATDTAAVVWSSDLSVRMLDGRSMVRGGLGFGLGVGTVLSCARPSS